MKVSILIPIYNGEKFIERCFNSIFSSTFQDYEVVAVNDGSTDNTETLLSEWKQKDERVSVYTIEHSGIVSALNYGLEKCKGEYIARLDVDDEMLPNRLDHQISFLDSSDYDIIGGEIIIEPGEAHVFKRSQDCTMKNSLCHPELCHPSVMFKSSSLKKYDLKYIEGTDDFEDVVLFIEALKRGLKLRNLSGAVIKKYHHENQVTVKKRDILMRQIDYIQSHYEDLLKKYNIKPIRR